MKTYVNFDVESWGKNVTEMLSLQLFKHVAYYYEYQTADDCQQTSQQLIQSGV